MSGTARALLGPKTGDLDDAQRRDWRSLAPMPRTSSWRASRSKRALPIRPWASTSGPCRAGEIGGHTRGVRARASKARTGINRPRDTLRSVQRGLLATEERPASS